MRWSCDLYFLKQFVYCLTNTNSICTENRNHKPDILHSILCVVGYRCIDNNALRGNIQFVASLIKDTPIHQLFYYS